MKYCSNCGAPNEDDAKFCVTCGSQLSSPAAPVMSPPVAAQQAQVQERVFFKGEGTLIIRRTKQKGQAVKGVSMLLGPVGYLAFGRDKKSKTKAEGELIVTNKSLYCAGNSYPFEKLLSLTREGKKSVAIEFESDVGPGGGGNISIEAELRMNSREECDQLFEGLQHARTSHLQI